MPWLQRIKTIEVSLGLAIAALVGWMALGWGLNMWMKNWELTPTVGNRLLAAAILDLGLVLVMAVAGFLAGLLLKGGPWALAIATVLLTIFYRSMVHVVIGDPHPFWKGWVEVVVLLLFTGAAVYIFALLFRWADKMTRRPGVSPPDSTQSPD